MVEGLVIEGPGDGGAGSGRAGDEGLVIKVSSNGCRRRQWHPTPVLLPGKSHGWRNLVGCSPWGC